MTSPWRNAALRLADLELDLAYHDWLASSSAPAYDPARHEAAEQALADWLHDLIDCAGRRVRELAARHAPAEAEPPPEKAAGRVSTSVHG